MNRAESKYFNTAVKMDLALISLLKKKSFEYITVSEICKAAGVNRSTFYLHYETLGDLLDETAQYLFNDFLSYFTPDKSSISLNFQDCNPEEMFYICDKYLTPYLSYIKDNKEVFGTVLLHSKAFRFDEVYKRLFENIFNPILERFKYPENSREYVMTYYLNGINAIIKQWLKFSCDLPIKEISEIISICIYGLNKQLLSGDFSVLKN